MTQDNREPEVLCYDGFKMSVQASRTHYSVPRVDGFDTFYKCVEVGFPNRDESLLNPYEDGPDSQVYAYVPAVVIHLILQKHQGMVGGNLPNLNLNDSYDELDESYDELTYQVDQREFCDYPNNTMKKDEIEMYENSHICSHGNSRASNCHECNMEEE